MLYVICLRESAFINIDGNFLKISDLSDGKIVFVFSFSFYHLSGRGLSFRAGMKMRRIWLVTTDHMEDELWFRDLDDFKVAMNYMAIQAASHPNVKVLAFILMSNHVHIVIKGTSEDVLMFIVQFKHRYSIYMRKKWGVKEFLRRNGIDIKEIPYDAEAVERAIAYVQMNCVAASICTHPCQYSWGTGDTFFSPERPMTAKRVGDLKGRERERLLHSNSTVLPKHWRINAEGYVLPQEYVDVQSVEKLFRTAQRMNYFYTSSSKARKRLELEENLPAFRDQIILSAIPDLCRSLFQKESFTELTSTQKAEFMRQIRYRFSADVNQIARVCGVGYADAAKMMDSAQ